MADKFTFSTIWVTLKLNKEFKNAINGQWYF